MLEKYILICCHYFESLGNIITLEMQYHARYNDEKIIIYFLIQNMMSSITTQNLKLKQNLCIAKQNRKIFLSYELDQLKQLEGVNCNMHVSLGGYLDI